MYYLKITILRKYVCLFPMPCYQINPIKNCIHYRQMHSHTHSPLPSQLLVNETAIMLFLIQAFLLLLIFLSIFQQLKLQKPKIIHAIHKQPQNWGPKHGSYHYLAFYSLIELPYFGYNTSLLLLLQWLSSILHLV